MVCKGNGKMKMQLSAKELILITVATDNMTDDVGVTLGMDVIDELGGVTVTRNTVKFCEHRRDMMPTHFCQRLMIL